MTVGKHSLILCGGGIDSYVSTWINQLKYPDERTILLYVDYGAKSRINEMRATSYLSQELSKKFGKSTSSTIVISMDLWTRYLSSPLTDDGISVNRNPHSGVAHEWVPARNTVLMSVALAVAENNHIARIVCGINKTAAVAY